MSRQPVAGLRVSTCQPGGGAVLSLPVNVGPCVTVPRVCVCVCFSGMEDSYTVTCGLPLPCLAADAQRNGSGLHCAGEWENETDWHLSSRRCLTKQRGRACWIDTPLQSGVTNTLADALLASAQARRRPACRASRPRPRSGRAPPSAT